VVEVSSHASAGRGSFNATAGESWPLILPVLVVGDVTRRRQTRDMVIYYLRLRYQSVCIIQGQCGDTCGALTATGRSDRGEKEDV
jgi:hypothetical protein